MTKRILFSILFSVFAGIVAQAQIKHSQWTVSSKKINTCEYDVVFTLTLDPGWHTFSVVKIKDAEGEVFPTEIIFKPSKEYALVGTLTETTPIPFYDKTIQKTVLLHEKRVVFTQRIKLKSGRKIKVSGTYQNQECNDHVCNTPPSDSFDIDLQGTAACVK